MNTKLAKLQQLIDNSLIATDADLTIVICNNLFTITENAAGRTRLWQSTPALDRLVLLSDVPY